MRKFLTSFALVTACWLSLAAARAGCASDPDGALICGEGKDAVSIFTETILPPHPCGADRFDPPREGRSTAL